MLGRITEISEVDNIVLDDTCMGGYKVVTEKHTFNILVGGGNTFCCGDTGRVSSEADLKKYIGSNLLGFDEWGRNVHPIIEEYLYGVDCLGFNIIVEFITDRGMFQLGVFTACIDGCIHPALVILDNRNIREDIL